MLQLWQDSAAPLRALDLDGLLLKRSNERCSRNVGTHWGLKDKTHTGWRPMGAVSGTRFLFVRVQVALNHWERGHVGKTIDWT